MHFIETFIVINKEENYRSKCTRVQVNNKSDGDEFKEKKQSWET